MFVYYNFTKYFNFNSKYVIDTRTIANHTCSIFGAEGVIKFNQFT